MAQQDIILGNPIEGPDEPGADTLYEGFVKVNDNFTENYDSIATIETGITLEYTVATLPSASTNDNVTIIVSDDADGRILATSDATNWRRCSNGLVVSDTLVSPKIHIEGEYTPAGVLVYPYATSQTVAYNTDMTINYLSTSYVAEAWLLVNTYTNGLITSILAANPTTNWKKTIVYSAEGIISSEGDWILQ